jgi:uncharacterized membrane protein (DUF106 family)
VSTGIEIAATIFMLCFVLAIVSKLIQKKLLDKDKMKSLKSQVKDKQKEMKELVKGGNNEKAAKLQKEIMEITMEMMQGTQKVMFVSLPIFLVFFAGLGYFFGGITFQSLIPLPKFVGFNILNPGSWIPVGVTIMTGYYKAYFFYYLISTITIAIIEKVIEKIRK